MSDLVKRLENMAEVLIESPKFSSFCRLVYDASGEIERLTAEVAAAKVALQTHPCILEDGNFDHEWKFVDDSFDHEFGTYIETYYQCKCCKATKDD